MAKKIDKDLFDRLVKRQIAVGRYAERQAYEIIKLLNRADKELLAKIIDRGESGSFTGRRLEALLKETRSMVDKSYRELFDVTKAEMEQFAPHAGEFAAATLSMSLPAAWSPVSISDEQLVAIVDKAPISVGKDKKLLLEEVFRSMAAGKEEMIRGALRLGMVQGEDVQTMVRRLKGTRSAQYQDGLLEGSRRSMANMVRSVVQHTNNVAVQSIYEKNSDIMNGWVYVATLDSKTCHLCYSQSGKQFPLGEGPLPIRHVGCRCATIPAIKSFKELGFDLPEFGKFERAAKGGPVDADISFNDWLKDQDSKTQVELLGPARARLFADGKVHLDKFTDASGNLYTLSELKSRM